MTWTDKGIEPDTRKCMWEILVPTEKRVKTSRPNPAHFNPMGDGPTYESALTKWSIQNSYSTRYHRVWDAEVRRITGGLTILTPAKGQWVSPDGELFSERMIPVRIVAARAEIDRIIDFTLEYYDQLAVLCAKVSEEVIIRHRTS